MDLCTGGTLYNIMERFETQKLSYKQLLQMFFHISRAVLHMHSQKTPIAHRDLKLENVLLHRGSGMFKLCDFGSVTTVAKAFDPNPLPLTHTPNRPSRIRKELIHDLKSNLNPLTQRPTR